jgi:holo-ACP synthase
MSGIPAAAAGAEGLDRPVGLEEVLACRERRAARQLAAVDWFQRPVVGFTLVVPGPRKAFPATRVLLEAGLVALDALLAARGWPVLMGEHRFLPTGPEALRVVDAGGPELKRALAALEDRHPLGRLWDLDVHCPGGAGLSRQDLGLPPRRCLLCGQPAHACSRSRAHPLPDLLAEIEARVEAWRQAAGGSPT